MLSGLGGFTTFAIFAALSALALWFMHRIAPETKDRSLEDVRIYWDNGGHWHTPPPDPHKHHAVESPHR